MERKSRNKENINKTIHKGAISLQKNVKKLEEVIVDLLDGQSRWDEIRNLTGCSEERAREIEEVLIKIKEKG